MILLPLISKLRFASIQITKGKLGQSPFPTSFLCLPLVLPSSGERKNAVAWFIKSAQAAFTCVLQHTLATYFKCSYDGCLLEHLVNTGTKAAWIRLKSICEEKNNEICKSIQTDFAWEVGTRFPETCFAFSQLHSDAAAQGAQPTRQSPLLGAPSHTYWPVVEPHLIPAVP